MTSRGPVVLTGATGFLGGALLRRLVAEGIPVRALSRSIHGDRPGVEWVRGDLTIPDSLIGLVAPGSLVIHAGASPAGEPAEVHRSIVDGTDLIATMVRQAGGRMLHVSSVAVLDPAVTGSVGVVDESAPLDPAPHLRGPYSHAKHAAEALVQTRIASGLDAVVVRPGQLVGEALPKVPPSCGSPVAGMRLIFGRRDGIVPTVHVDDAAAGIILMANQAARGATLHLVDPRPVRRAELLRAMRLAGVPAAQLPAVPAAWLGRLLGWSGPGRAHRIAALDSRADWSADLALSLGWQPRQLANWLATGRDG